LLLGDTTSGPIHHILPASGVTLPPPPANLDEYPFRLCVFHFADLHGNVSRLTEYGGQPVFSRLVWALRDARRRIRHDPHQAVLFLSGGDDLAGSVFDELLGHDPSSYVVHAVYRLYAAAGVDVGVLGNHDFDQGPDLLAHAIERDARFPLLSANLRASSPLAEGVYPAALLVVKGIRVGIIGLTTSAEIKHRPGASFSVTHPLTAAQNLLPALRPLCDVLIILSHLGHDLETSSAPTCDAGDVELAQSLPPGSVHLIVGGHTHLALNETGLGVGNVVNGIPIVEAGSSGRFLGEVHLTIGPGAAVTSAHLTLTVDLPVDEEFESREVQPLLAQAGPVSTQRLGKVADHPDLVTDAVRDSFAAGESALANLIADALVVRAQAAGHPVDLAAIDASSICCGLPVGRDLTFGDWFRLMPYSDTLCLYRLSGSQLASLLDDNARRADRPGAPHIERGFLQFSQHLRYVIDLGSSRPAARATQVTVDGVPLEQQAERTFLLACTSFVRQAAASWERHAVSRLGFPILESVGPSCSDTDLLIRDLLVAHIRQHGGVTEEAGACRDGRLRLLTSSPTENANVPLSPGEEGWGEGDT
jgi:2',3'-cyclic-nucleotide 2'-phosphodiesterase (5'-nucleotidase family)